MNTIELYKQNGLWIADDKSDLLCLEVFGTTAVPTPFKDFFNQEEVKKQIQDLNPGKLVIIKE